MTMEVPYVVLLLTLMLMAIALILQTLHYAKRIGDLEERIAELTKLLGSQSRSGP